MNIPAVADPSLTPSVPLGRGCRRRWFAVGFLALALTAAVAGEVAPAAALSQRVRGRSPMRTYSFEEIGNISAGVRLGVDPVGRLTAIQAGAFLMFDGQHWTDMLESTNARRAMQVAEYATDGTLFCAAAGNWGYFETTPTGTLLAHSLRPEQYPDWVRNLEFTSIHFCGDWVAFGGNGGLALFNRRSGRTRFEEVPELKGLLVLDGKIFLSSLPRGHLLFDPKTGELTATPDSSGLPPFEKTAAWDEGRALVVSPKDGISLFDGRHSEPWRTEIDPWLRDGVTAIRTLAGGLVAVAIRGHGVQILDREGRHKWALDEGPLAEVDTLCSPEPGVLWLATQHGLTKVLYGPPVQQFDDRQGLRLTWPHLLTRDRSVYVLSGERLYEPVPGAPTSPTRFRPIECGDIGGIEAAVATAHGWLLATREGIFAWDEKRPARLVSRDLRPVRLVAADEAGDSCLSVGPTTIAVLRWDGREWREWGERIAGIGHPSHIMSVHPGSWWLELGVNRVGRIRLREGRLHAEVFRMPPGSDEVWLGVGAVGSRVVIGQSKGQRMYFDEEQDTFVEAPDLQRVLNTAPFEPLRPRSDARGRIWASHVHGVFRIDPQADGTYRSETEAFVTLRDNYPVLNMLDNGEVWTRSEHMLQRIEQGPEVILPRVARPQLTRVTDTRRHVDLYNALSPVLGVWREASWRSNSLAFHFFHGTHGLMRNFSYQYRLEGYADDWSAPVSGGTLVFNGLTAGRHQLRVRLTDENGPIGQETTVAFVVTPPVYLAWYAWLAYGALVIGALYAGDLWRSRRARRRNLALESLVQARTSELDQANGRLQNLVREAQHAASAKSRFLAHMSHEIRTPMNGVLGMVGELAVTELAPKQREMCRVVQTSAESLLTIIDDILDFTKIEHGKLQVVERPMDLRQLVTDTVALFAPLAREKGLALGVDLALEPVCWVLGDAVRLRQVLGNLVGNAVKFTEAGSITVGVASSEGGGFRFEVADTGLGIADEDQARLFRPFEQVDEGTTRQFGGTGLGLAICRYLVELMGGRIGVSSRKGVGAKFWFEMPLPRTAAVVPRAPKPGQAGPARALRILVVDDNETNRAVAGHVLARLGHQMEEAGDGLQALEHLATAACDLVLMDCQMPRLDGYEATRRIRGGAVPGANAQVPIVGLTAYALPEERERGLAAGMNDYVAKPFKPEEIERVLVALGLAAPAGLAAPWEAAGAEHWDAAHLASLALVPGRDGRPMAETLFRLFGEQMPATLATLAEQLKTRQAEALAATAHQLAGRAANLGARVIHPAANDLESAARAADWTAAEQALAAIETSWHQLTLHPEPWLQHDENENPRR